ncbi:MAG: 4a-hydroxytetrahydrobiopterin dehydratase [Chloroflexota bacterium]|jgi:4a-hydroxytetrahydrobiopterin dehydratase|nr:4a-hydroxytetrahydrobiopterin dehydratase [Chloroflexota bacterium]MDP6508970.1 4a-hydroxytetrahydrobiopterin dehydratase [Chloroflexota bacterium]MDP6758069.1 4a-hydroxytetrahydrobiopterin dehydratase [Chloroflexota bacterium]
MVTRLTLPQIERALVTPEGWERQDASITRQFEFATFAVAIEFVRAVSEVAEAMDHHPDIDSRYQRVRIALSTHSAAGVTDLDFALAGRYEEIARGSG